MGVKVSKWLGALKAWPNSGHCSQWGDGHSRGNLGRAARARWWLTGGPKPFLNFALIFQNWFELPKSKIENGTFLTSKNYGKFKTGRWDEKEQLCPLVKLPNCNRIWNINSTICWDLNIKGIQTSWENCQKFSKIMICQVLHNCNFRWPHLHREIPSFFTMAIRSTLEKNGLKSYWC
jgi:hypothetical protein